MGTGMQLQLGAQQRAAQHVVDASETIADDVTLFGDALEQNLPHVTGSAIGLLVGAIELWSESLRVFHSDLQKYAEALVAVDRNVSDNESQQLGKIAEVGAALKSRMEG
ncbi:MAG: hypothetical protein Q4D79_08475 [Propionibacteriaceae bacterium]|nr:hypothetical protein [Propionibacteriaceae bacterium]